MADPLQVLSSLETLADHYAIFEPDQVLTHGQLNSVSDFWGDQVRLSRVALAAVGLVSGLHVGRADGAVRITRGLGVSTDGDLMTLAADTVYDRFRPYDTSAPIYRPFYRGTTGDGAPTDMMTLHELVPAGESDVLARPLADLPSALAGMAVVMLMETVVNDPDLCSGTDCDNLGRDALHRMRLLLIARADAENLLNRRPLRPASERAQALQALAMRRPVLSREVNTTALLAQRYRESAAASLDDLRGALPGLAEHCPEVLAEMFDADPTARWRATLATLASQFNAGNNGLQVWYGFVKDLVDHWNELREALLADDSVLLPNVAAFPKHLLLGAIAAPRELRTGLYPSPLDASARQQSAHARFLAWKLDAMIAAFQLPTDDVLRVTPSAGDKHPLEERAIPWFYRLREDPPIHVAWNFRLSARRQEGHNLGYRSAEWASTARARSPLLFAIGGHDFFRIEGHLGREVEVVSAELRRQIAERNLPFQLQAVLLNNARGRIRVRPGFRYTPLHSLHHLVRQDVAFRLDEGVQFGQQYLGNVTASVQQNFIVDSGDDGATLISAAQAASQAVASANQIASPVLSQTSYSGYMATLATGPGSQWTTTYATTLGTLASSRANLGHVSRTDFVSPFDGLISTNQPHWVNWLDTLIADLDTRADDRLMLTRFVQDHPGLDHLGGVWRGGTFVLVYDNDGRVVADFTLPYPAAEVDEPEPTHPVLPRPPFRPPQIVGNGIRVVKPIDLQVRDRFVVERDVFQRDLDLQTAGIEGLVKGAFVPNNAAPPKGPRTGTLTGNPYLDVKANELFNQRALVEQLQDVLTNPGLTNELREEVERDLGRAQDVLADTLGIVAEQVVASGIELNSQAGTELRQELTTGVSTLQSREAKAKLDTKLGDVQRKAGTGHAAMLGNLRRIGK